jgi:hypothetical protein
MVEPSAASAPIGLPDVHRADSVLVVLGEWHCATVEHQRDAIDAAIEAWRTVEWPDILLHHTVYACTDDATVVPPVAMG